MSPEVARRIDASMRRTRSLRVFVTVRDVEFVDDRRAIVRGVESRTGVLNDGSIVGPTDRARVFHLERWENGWVIARIVDSQ
jgi:hypothetical protein